MAEVVILKNESHPVGLGTVLDYKAVRGMKALVRTEKFVVARIKKPLAGCFAVVNDGKEVSAVIDQSRFDESDALEVERDWRVITFGAVLPFELMGFLAFVLSALAEAGVGVFVISAYSTDHLLVKERDLEKALLTLREAGFKIVLA